MCYNEYIKWKNSEYRKSHEPPDRGKYLNN